MRGLPLFGVLEGGLLQVEAVPGDGLAAGRVGVSVVTGLEGVALLRGERGGN